MQCAADGLSLRRRDVPALPAEPAISGRSSVALHIPDARSTDQRRCHSAGTGHSRHGGGAGQEVVLSEVQTMDRVDAEATAEPRFYVLLLGTFAAVALVLAAVGIYGVISYSVSRRTQEIGTRIALGAQARDLIRLVVRQGLFLALIGLSGGSISALAVTRLMSDLL